MGFASFFVTPRAVFADEFFSETVEPNTALVVLRDDNHGILDKAFIKQRKDISDGLSINLWKIKAEAGQFDRTLSYLKSRPEVAKVLPNPRISRYVVPSDPYWDDLWGMQRMSTGEAWEVATGNSTVVAVLDTGIDMTHEDLEENIWSNAEELGADLEGNQKSNNSFDDDGNDYIDDYRGWNFVSSTNDPTDNNGHGTHVAGTIAAIGNNGVGVVGVNWQAKLMPLKILDSSGGGYLSYMLEALIYAADNGARVANMSLGAEGLTPDLIDIIQSYVDYAHARGMVMVAAAGNITVETPDPNTDNNYPSAANHVISVGAMDLSDQRASFSKYGSTLDFVAPGVNILSTRATGTGYGGQYTAEEPQYSYSSGTSMASPHVAGLAALMLSVDADLPPEGVYEAIKTTCQDLGVVGRDDYFGAGVIGARLAVDEIGSLAVMVNSQISVDKTEAIADGIDLIFATVVLRDGANNPLPGKTVVLTTEDRGLYYDLAQITDVNGEAGIAFVGTASGTKTIKAFNVTDRGWVNGSSVIQFSPGEISSTKSRLFVPDDKTFAYVGYTLSVYLKAIDIWGNPITGQEIEFLSNRMDDVLGQPIGGDGEGVHTGKISSDYEGISIVTARTIVGGIDVGEAKEITFYRAGDTNFDQSVDLTDISILVYNYGKEGGDIVNTWTDINKDGVVDLTDISIMIYHYDG